MRVRRREYERHELLPDGTLPLVLDLSHASLAAVLTKLGFRQALAPAVWQRL